MPNRLENDKQTVSSRASAGLTAALALAIVARCIFFPAQVVAAPKGAVVSGITGTSLPSTPGSISRVTAGGETLHVLVGHSLFLNTRARLRRVYVADPTVLNSVTLSPNQIVVTAIASGISTLVLLDETGQAQSYIVSADIDIAGLHAAMNEAMRSDAVKIEGSGNHITLSGQVSSQALEDTALKLAGLYTKDVANALTITPDHAKQVRLKVRILVVDRAKALQMGVNLFNPGGNTSFLASTTTSQYASTSTYASSSLASGTLTTTNPLNFLLYSTKLNLGANIQDLESKQVLQILAEPTITTISGEKAEFHSGGEFPFPTVTGTGSSATVSISFRPYGVALVFTPIVNEDGSIRLKVAPEVSALDYSNAVSIDGYTIPALSTRKAETEVELRSDQSFAISGLLDQRTTDILDKTPGASSIPILGALFKSKNSTHSTTELVVVVTPTLVDPLNESTDPVQPDLPVQRLQTDKFDKGLGKNLTPQPAAPPINSPGAMGSPIPVASPSPAAVTTPPAAETTPVPALSAPIAESIQVPASSVTITPPAAGMPQNIPPMQTTQAASPSKSVADSGAKSAADNIHTQAPLAPAAAATPAQTPSAPVATPPYSQTASPLPTGIAAPTQTQTASSDTVYGPYIPYHPSSTEGSTAVKITAPQTTDSTPVTRNNAVDSSTGASRANGQLVGNINPSAHLMVQIMALSNPKGAESMVSALKRDGYDVTVNHNSQDSLLHLEVGPFASKPEAEAMRQRLLRDGYNAVVK
jgi:pilus assembly protein CpaC